MKIEEKGSDGSTEPPEKVPLPAAQNHYPDLIYNQHLTKVHRMASIKHLGPSFLYRLPGIMEKMIKIKYKCKEPYTSEMCMKDIVVEGYCCLAVDICQIDTAVEHPSGITYKEAMARIIGKGIGYVDSLLQLIVIMNYIADIKDKEMTARYRICLVLSAYAYMRALRTNPEFVVEINQKIPAIVASHISKDGQILVLPIAQTVEFFVICLKQNTTPC